MAERPGPFLLVIHVMPTSPRKGTVMPERQPRFSDDSPIGPDVDLERDDIRLADGTRLTPDIAAGIAEDVRRAAIIGRTGPALPLRPPGLPRPVPGKVVQGP